LPVKTRPGGFWRGAGRDLLYVVASNAVSATIAVAGTLLGSTLGSTLTYYFQRRSSDRSEVFLFNQQLRGERVVAYSAFVTALTEFRRGQLDWYERRKEDPDSATTMAARVESYRLKGVALTALSHVQLVADNQALVAAADGAFEVTRVVHYAEKRAELDAQTGRAAAALQNFIALASAEAQAALAVTPGRRDRRERRDLTSPPTVELSD
jgi:hypothetical protein